MLPLPVCIALNYQLLTVNVWSGPDRTAGDSSTDPKWTVPDSFIINSGPHINASTVVEPTVVGTSHGLSNNLGNMF